MTATYIPYTIDSTTGAYIPQVYPGGTAPYPVLVVNGETITPGTTPMSLKLTNITEFSDEPANKATFEYAGDFQDVPIFFMKTNKAASMSFKITCNAYSSMPLFLKYCNSWGKLDIEETEFQGEAVVGTLSDISITRSFYVTMESTIAETPVNYGKTRFEITLKFTRVQI